MRTQTMMCMLMVLTLALGCAELEDSSDPQIQAHHESWIEPASGDFHGERVLEYGIASCMSCHDIALGKANESPSCNACHDGAGGHPYGWASPSSDDFHADTVAAFGTEPCQYCHGMRYEGDAWSNVSCYTCHAMGPSGHVDGWLDPVSLSFHGRKVLEEGPSDCRRCHGFDLAGGSSGLACSSCHLELLR